MAILLFCFEVPQVPLPNSKLLSMEAASVTVKQQNLSTPQATATREVENKDGAKASIKQAKVSESNKSAKAGKKQQGTCLSHYQVYCLSCICWSVRLLFVIVMEALSREFRITLPWKLFYADNFVVIAETEDDLIKRLNKWKDNVENRGLRVNMNKAKVMISGEW